MVLGSEAGACERRLTPVAPELGAHLKSPGLELTVGKRVGKSSTSPGPLPLGEGSW